MGHDCRSITRTLTRLVAVLVPLLAVAVPLVWFLSRDDAAEPSGHERMQAILQEISASTDNDHPFLGSATARGLEQRFANECSQGCPPLLEWGYSYDLAIALVRLGEVERGIQHLERALELLPRVDFGDGVRSGLVAGVGPVDPQMYYECSTRFELGVGYLRLGETRNCCLKHNAESCILPIRGGGLHSDRTGSEKAATVLLGLLETLPDRLDLRTDLELRQAAKWLLNVAHMTLGDLPDGVPTEHRLARDFLESDVEFPRFPNVAPRLGLDTFNLCGGAVVDDFDGDEFLEDGQTRSVYRDVGSGGRFGGNPLRQTIGLGHTEAIERLEVLWPTTGRTSTFEDVPLDRFLEIVEGETGYEVRDLPATMAPLGGAPK